MIDRYVFIKLDGAHATPAGRAEVARHTLSALRGLPGVQAVTVGQPADDATERSWDVSIVVRFASIDDVQPYLDHPDHRAYVDDYLAPRMQVIKAWNFEVATAPPS